MSATFFLLLQVAAAPSSRQVPHRLPETPAITAAELRRHVEVLADDSMLGRGTPGEGLERAAAYVAARFAALGLRPAGDAGGYEQRWGLFRWVPDTAVSRIELTAPGWRATPRLGRDVRYVAGPVDGRVVEGEALLLEDSPADGRVEGTRFQGRVVVFPVDYSRPLPVDLPETVERIAAEAAAVLILSNRDSAAFARRLEAAAAPRLTADFRAADGGAPVLEVHQRALGSRRPGDGTRVSIRLERAVLDRHTAPNLLGIVEGTDPVLGREFVAVSAHVDGVGLRPGAPDSINNGADDNASGLAALLEIGQSFAAAPPRRSVLLLAASGEELGLWGSDYFVRHPTVPLDRVVATLNMDLIGRNWTDSVIVVGPEFSTLGATLRRVVAAHPGLRMGPIADRWPEERIFYRSDHYHFARAGVPILFFTSGTHPDYHQPGDSPDRVDAEKAARVASLVYQVARAAANDPERPRWSPDSYRRIVEEK